MTVFVVGDSVAEGIAGAIPNSRELGTVSATVPQMEENFRTAINEARTGDTVIISAGYNGFSRQHATQLQGWVQELREKGATVVIAGIRETGMDAERNRQYAETNRLLGQIATATGAVFSNQCIAIGNRNPAGNVHGGYEALATACLASARSGGSSETPERDNGNEEETRNGTGNGTGNRQETEADPNESFSAKMRRWANQVKESMPGFFGNLLGGILEMLAGLIESIGGMFSGSGDSSRTLTQEITDVTTALGIRGQSGALQDNTLSTEEKNRLKIEVQQVQAALPSTMTDEVRQNVTGMLSALQAGGVQDTDEVLGSAITGLRTAIQPARQ